MRCTDPSDHPFQVLCVEVSTHLRIMLKPEECSRHHLLKIEPHQQPESCEDQRRQYIIIVRFCAEQVLEAPEEVGGPNDDLQRNDVYDSVSQARPFRPADDHARYPEQNEYGDANK